MGDRTTPDRALSRGERAMLRWLLERGDEDARAMLPQVDHARVVGRCACGCASLELAVDGRPADDAAMATVTPDYFWTGPDGGLCGIFVFAKGGTLVGLEVWSVDGGTTPATLPAVGQLRLAEELPP